MASAAVASRLGACQATTALHQRSTRSLSNVTRSALPSFSGLKAAGALGQSKSTAARPQTANARRPRTVAPQATMDPVRNPLYGRTHSSQWANNQYTFEVDDRATKTEIRSFLEAVFQVRVVSINTWKLPNKVTRRGGSVGVKVRRKRATAKVAWGQRMRVYPDPRSYINE
ncbi:chloroplast 50S ribosomal protein L23, precursor [Klebsormidium nitens]|uniref:Chloroplast 50S ribosomal protein L23 n=1 Tax=Klebsormidium nitens TaxID=105231 RepID=A0A1Y1IVC1_KLENI|nr:chloroplast 50S ribosomal protein L23, precursor [Klebsormidium nitens]|eukprot:GAQ92806.1 chloroplast 50S ribosomal protein L23, precursor [Klebsormidium nitens]